MLDVRGLLAFLAAWVAVVVLAYVVAGSGAGTAALLGGSIGAIRALMAMHLMGRRGARRRQPE